MSNEPTGYLEDCCWTWLRDQCRGKGCACLCHVEYPNPADENMSAIRLVERAGKLTAQLAAANATIAARDAELADARAALDVAEELSDDLENMAQALSNLMAECGDSKRLPLIIDSLDTVTRFRASLARTPEAAGE